MPCNLARADLCLNTQHQLKQQTWPAHDEGMESLPTNLELAKFAPRISTPENTFLVRSMLE